MGWWKSWMNQNTCWMGPGIGKISWCLDKCWFHCKTKSFEPVWQDASSVPTAKNECCRKRHLICMGHGKTGGCGRLSGLEKTPRRCEDASEIDKRSESHHSCTTGREVGGRGSCKPCIVIVTTLMLLWHSQVLNTEWWAPGYVTEAEACCVNKERDMEVYGAQEAGGGPSSQDIWKSKRVHVGNMESAKFGNWNRYVLLQGVVEWNNWGVSKQLLNKELDVG